LTVSGAPFDASPGISTAKPRLPFRLKASLKTVQEFSRRVEHLPAEFGTGTGGQIGLITKSGGE
jgi:hypothetical protein